MNISKKQIDNRIIIDIAKGICIISIVLGHSCSFGSFFYLFHLQVFFFINGLLLNTSYSIKEFLKKRIIGLYIPYVIIMFIISLLFDFSSLKNLKNIVKILLFDGNVIGLGAMWFVPCLFINNFISFCLHKIFQSLKMNVLFLGIFILLAFLCYYHNYSLYYNFHLIPYIQIIYCLSFFVKKDKLINIIQKHNFIYLFFSFIIIYITYKVNIIKIDLVNSELINPLLWLLNVVVAIVFVFSLSVFIYLYLPVNIIDKLGNASFYIMAFHFFSFGITNFFLMLFKDSLDLSMIKNFNVIYTKFSILYSINGILIPTGIYYLQKITKEKICHEILV